MKQRNIVFLLIAVIAVIAVNYSWNFAEPPLTVHLRCDREVSGTLQVNIILPNEETDGTESFDIRKVCENGEIEFNNYQRERIIKFTFMYSGDKEAQLTSKYGIDIQSDQNGYYMVLKISNTLPFITNDSI